MTEFRIWYENVGCPHAEEDEDQIWANGSPDGHGPGIADFEYMAEEGWEFMGIVNWPNGPKFYFRRITGKCNADSN
ncbi:hypothetical protein LCGC14_2413390 [marine sediment metagenome]|uniref:DUF4177 domain-containing protein n=1 Tax=marine sediment metagenome TaxID=412755 RepID=A0A0F9CDX4_9ZZZZ